MTVEAIIDELRDTLARKGADYGKSIFLPAPLVPNLDPATAILVRMGDKIRRLENIATKRNEVADETFDDTILDLAGYCVLYLTQARANREKAKYGKDDRNP